jgi:Fe-S metabolism associated domain
MLVHFLGLIAILFALYSGKSARDILTIDSLALFDRIGLREKPHTAALERVALDGRTHPRRGQGNTLVTGRRLQAGGSPPLKVFTDAAVSGNFARLLKYSTYDLVSDKQVSFVMLCLPVRHQAVCNFAVPPFVTALPPARVKPGSAEISCPLWVIRGHCCMTAPSTMTTRAAEVCAAVPYPTYSTQVPSMITTSAVNQ